MVCPYCELTDHPVAECPERLEEYHGTASDHFDNAEGVRCWVQDLDDTWHASMYFEDTRHVAACGEIFETPVADVRHDPRRLADAAMCDACAAALEDDESDVTVPDGGEFEPASDLRADGGVDLEEWILEHVDELQAPVRGPWSSREHLKKEGRKLDGVDPEDVEDAIDRLVAEAALISWHGLLAPTDDETLTEIIEAELESEVTRSILVGKCNRIRQESREDERVVATDGGVDVGAVREAVPFWVRARSTTGGRAIHVPDPGSTREEPDSACHYGTRSKQYGAYDVAHFGPEDLERYLCDRCAEIALDADLDTEVYGRMPADIVAEAGLEAEDGELRTDGGRVTSTGGTERIEEILDERYEDRIYCVENDVVWVSGMNANCGSVARRMAKELAHSHDIPTTLVYDDDAARFGGVQFNWGESA